MKRVYLDQLHWISLARVASGTDLAASHRDIFDLVTYAGEHELASFPLSATHYYETMKRGDPRSRRQLGKTMSQISRHHTMAGIVELLNPEAALALAGWYQLPLPPPPRVFGVGFRHAFGQLAGSFTSPQLERAATAVFGPDAVADFFEEAMIMGPTERLPSGEIHRPDERWSLKQLEDERAITARINAHGHTPHLARSVVMAEEATHALRAINEVAFASGLPLIHPSTKDEIDALVFAMPAKGVLTRMRMSAHENANFKWELGDLSDITSLSVAAAYCDIVVTEKKWGSILKRHQAHINATVLTSLGDLGALLMTP